MSTTHRYVPQGSASIASDAPGWSAKNQTEKSTNNQNADEGNGPVCWKCKGACTLKLRAHDRKKQKTERSSVTTSVDINAEEDEQRSCPVCDGKGYLPIRSKYKNATETNEAAGTITARRRRPKGWLDFGHFPAAIQACDSLIKETKELPYALKFLSAANGSDDDYSPRKDVPITNVPERSDKIPAWLPINPGEQLCNLVGKWRILQKVGSHRWTTDDIMTAYIAATSLIEVKNVWDEPQINYLDLGTGNGSVLQMAIWYLLGQNCDVVACGVEARSEAVGLARRSLDFNIGQCEFDGTRYLADVIDKNSVNFGPGWHDVRVVNGDFRDLISLVGENESSETSNENEEMKQIASHKYDLITGTPPYFRVDFSTDRNTADDTKEQVVTAAVINQGGMPTSMQSAPARCEFRGGVEAYCETAEALLAPDGIFVVCENWLNNDRVWKGADDAGLEIIKLWPVKGKTGKDVLFAVYIMVKKGSSNTVKSTLQWSNKKVEEEAIVVRGKNGKWTDQYASIMAHKMCIPPTSA